MMQKEVADRIEASPGSKTYGAISAAVQYYCEVEQVMSVPKEVLVPRPKKWMPQLCMQPTIRKETPVDLIDEKAFFADCIKAGFGQRRKTLLNSLTGTYGLSKDEIRTILEKAGIDPVRRAETLDMNEFADIANGVRICKTNDIKRVGDQGCLEKLRNFYRKYLKNYLVLLFVIAVGIDLVIETLARHSLHPEYGIFIWASAGVHF